MAKYALYVSLEAKPGKEAEVEAFLKQGAEMARAETGTVTWYGIKEDDGFDVLLTTDKNLAYQQNLNNRKIAIVALGRSRWSLIQPALPRIADAVNAAKPGSYTLVEIPGE